MRVLEDVLNFEIGSELGVEVEVELLELATTVSLFALAQVRFLVYPALSELEISELRADYSAELSGGWWFQEPPSEAHDRI